MTPVERFIERIRFVFETAAFRVLVLLARILPGGFMRAIGRGIGQLAFALDRKHRKVALANLRDAWGEEKTPEEQKRIAMECFANLGSQVTVVEFTEGALPGQDRDCVKVIERSIKKNKIKLITKAAAKSYEKAMKKAEGAQLQLAAAGAGSALVEEGEFKAALKQLEKGLKAAGDSPGPELLLALAQAEAGLGRKDKARSWRDRLTSEHGASPQAATAREELAKL